MPNNIVNFLEYKNRKTLEICIEELDIKVCTYNFLKKLKVKCLSDLSNINWMEEAKVHSKAKYIISDLHNLMFLPKEA